MILEKETYEKFGYYPSDLKPKSSKRILAACDDCGVVREVRKYSYSALCMSCVQKGEKNHFFGKQHTKETKQKLSDVKKGKKNSMFGRHHPEETKQRISDAQKGEKNPNFGKHHSEETRKKISDAALIRLKRPGERERLRKMRNHQSGKKTKPELIFEQICKKYNLPFKYTGDGAFWIGKNPAVNPDFVETNGKKVAIEIFSYWHDPLRRHCKIPYSQTYGGRKKILKKYGWKLVVFWQEDLERGDAEQFVLNELKKQGKT